MEVKKERTNDILMTGKSKQKLQGINILQLEAKDILNTEKVITFNKFHKGTLDNSLEVKKLEEIHRKVYRNNKFTYLNECGRLQSDDIVSVRFRYALGKVKPKDLRKILYNNGFVIEGQKFVRYKRSSGSSRIGNCLFIKEALLKETMKWSNMGLDEKQNNDLASYEASISLTLSSIIGTLKIKPENILIVEDKQSAFTDRVISVVQSGDTLKAREETAEITNDIWDGQSLLDSSMFTGDYQNKGFLLLRNQFFKSACFNTNIQQFFIDNNIVDVSQLNGFTLAKDISEIKLITTPNSVKYTKFGSKEQWLSKLDSTFGIVKFEKPTHFFDGNLVQTHYQLLNTLEFSEKEIEKILQPSFDYLKLLKNNLPVLRNHLKMMSEREYTVGKLISSGDFILNMLEINDSIQNTLLFRDFLNNNVTAPFRNKLLEGHVLIRGNYSTLFSNGYEMLQYSIGKYTGGSLLPVDSVICKNFTIDEELLCCRSPHITMGNLWVVKNTVIPEYNNYFNLTNEIICVNSIGSNHMQRLNSADYDSDSVLVTNDVAFVQKAKANYQDFLVPTSFVTGGKKEVPRTPENLSDLDIDNANNIIGEIINFSQCLNSLLWERKKNGLDYQEIYQDICILAAMSGIEIDKAKRTFSVSNDSMFEKLKVKYEYELEKKPVFLQFTETARKRNNRQKSKDKKKLKESTENVPLCSKESNINKEEKFRNFETSMDYLIHIVQSNIRRIEAPRVKNRMNFLEFLECSSEGILTGKANIKSAKKIVKLIHRCDKKTSGKWDDMKSKKNDDKMGKQELYQEIIDIERKYCERLKRFNPKVEDLKYILRNTNKSVLKTLSFLFELYPNEMKKLFWTKKEDVEIITPCEKEKHDYLIYSMPYENVQKCTSLSMGKTVKSA